MVSLVDLVDLVVLFVLSVLVIFEEEKSRLDELEVCLPISRNKPSWLFGESSNGQSDLS